ncbi:hypothetical protein [Allosphingosinicella vermicomposti]|uniref:hypothetical protein n=1 Tax=Allosphingosinicella vermicomposti TaxID=614671 RepID=UPI00131A4DE9|nr:hypothetical protein [Allosphingosinicella vermicomposti]
MPKIAAMVSSQPKTGENLCSVNLNRVKTRVKATPSIKRGVDAGTDSNMLARPPMAAEISARKIAKPHMMVAARNAAVCGLNKGDSQRLLLLTLNKRAIRAKVPRHKTHSSTCPSTFHSPLLAHCAP